MKSVGIITIHNTQNNYGGALQCFGLYQYLYSKGFDVELIDLHRRNAADYVDSVRYMPMRVKLNVRTKIKGLIKEFLGIRQLRNPQFTPNWNPVAGKRFEAFNSMMKMSEPYSFIPDLYANPPHYDVYMAGSDQLWNPTQPYCLEPYFLTFVKDKNAKKVSYATSIGITELWPREKKMFGKWLQSFDHISVREQQACDLINNITRREITRVPDPTFLLDNSQWKKMAVAPECDADYILVFSLGREKCILNKAIEIARALNLQVKVIDQNFPSGTKYPDIDIIDDAGPLEFIGWIKHARLVLTDSFHCTVFSLITNTRNFYTYISPAADRGSRIKDMLEIYSLTDHIVHTMDEIPAPSSLEPIKIDHKLVNETMSKERLIGQEFLHTALK